MFFTGHTPFLHRPFKGNIFGADCFMFPLVLDHRTAFRTLCGRPVGMVNVVHLKIANSVKAYLKCKRNKVYILCIHKVCGQSIPHLHTDVDLSKVTIWKSAIECYYLPLGL